MRFRLALLLSLLAAPAFAQVTPGTSPLSGAKGGTNNAFMQFTGPAGSMKTFTLPNVSDTIALLAAVQTFTNKTLNCTNNVCTVRIGSDVTGLGTGVAAALGNALNAAGGLVGFNGALGTPASGTLTNATGLPTAGLVNNAVTNAKLATAADGTIKSNISGATAAPSDNTITAVLDKLGSTQGQILYRNATAWVPLTPGTAGQFLTTQGASANPTWSAGGAGTGTVTQLNPGPGISFSSGSNCTTVCTVSATGAPYFKVHLSGSTQSITSTFSKVLFDTVVVNVGNGWNSTNHNFNPQVAGTYKICATMQISGTFAANQLGEFDISKNGLSGAGGVIQAEYISFAQASTTSISSLSSCTLVTMNGTTDTIEIDAVSNGTSPLLSNSNMRTQMTGELVGP